MEEVFYTKLKELYPRYERVRNIMIAVEQCDKNKEAFLSPMNEMRNALDHVFKAIKYYTEDTEQFEHELREIKEHLGRAGYDIFDLYATNLGIEIKEKLNQFNIDTINAVIPDYYPIIKPDISDIEKRISECRGLRDINNDKYFESYWENITKLDTHNNNIDRLIPALIEHRERKEKEKQEQQKAEQKKLKFERLWQYLIGPIIGFAFAVLLWLLTKN